MRSTIAKAMAIAFSFGLVAAACSKSSNEASPSGGATASGSAQPSASASASASASPDQITIGPDQANDHGSQTVSGESSVEVEEDDNYFAATVLTGDPGQQLTVTLKNEGAVVHNFSIDDQNIDTDTQPGQEGSVTVTFPSSGFVEFYCKFHRQLGMAGELTVS